MYRYMIIMCRYAGLNISTGHRTSPQKNRVILDECYFTTDTDARREVKKNYELPTF